MAWRFRIEARDQLVDGVRVAVQFYDDSDPSRRPLAREVFTFPPGTTKAQALQQVVARGTDLRTAAAGAAQLAAQINPGDEGAV